MKDLNFWSTFNDLPNEKIQSLIETKRDDLIKLNDIERDKQLSELQAQKQFKIDVCEGDELILYKID